MPRGRRQLTVQETETLIELVEKTACLYDVTLAQHRDAQLVQNMWTSIANVMGKEDMDEAQEGFFATCDLGPF